MFFIWVEMFMPALTTVHREEVETRKIGRNETWTFQELFPGCTEVDEKTGKKHDMIVSFLMKRAWMAE